MKEQINDDLKIKESFEPTLEQQKEHVVTSIARLKRQVVNERKRFNDIQDKYIEIYGDASKIMASDKALFLEAKQKKEETLIDAQASLFVYEKQLKAMEKVYKELQFNIDLSDRPEIKSANGLKEILIRLRLQNSETLHQMAQRLGYTALFISEIERAAREVPEDFFQRLCDKYGGGVHGGGWKPTVPDSGSMKFQRNSA